MSLRTIGRISFGVAAALACLPPATTFATEPRHVIFAFVDHFEPINGYTGPNEVKMWVDDYMAMAGRHLDADGRHPVHTYFTGWGYNDLPGAWVRARINQLNTATFYGYGETEFHLHHGHPDETGYTQEQCRQELLNCFARAREVYTSHGGWTTLGTNPQIAFAFIHGMWALDNSRWDTWSYPGDSFYAWCGVNDELALLGEWGCFADFTFPAWGSMQPLIGDSLFWVRDDPNPASYKDANNIRLVQVGGQPYGDLMIVEGPATNTNIGYVAGSYDDAPTLQRMDQWVGHNVHVVGQGDWVFVKVYTHGVDGIWADAKSRDYFFGSTADAFYTAIEAKYNDGVNWKLHYVSAREMYNIARAAEAGMTGDPGIWRDYVVKPYANTRILTANSYQMRYWGDAVILEVLDANSPVDIRLKGLTTSAVVSERSELNPAVPWQPSNAQKQTGELGSLRITDTTPSRFYLFRPTSSAAVPGRLFLSVVHPELGGVAVEPNLPWYEPDTPVHLIATPSSEQARFVGWQVYDPCCPNDANHTASDPNGTLVIPLNGDRQVTAVFGQVLPGLRLTVSLVNPAWGSVTSDPNLTWYPPGAAVTLAATPVDGKRFTGWTLLDPNHPGDANYGEHDSNATISVLMDTDREVMASFGCGATLHPVLVLMSGILTLHLLRRRVSVRVQSGGSTR
jgi:hypothetical protein